MARGETWAGVLAAYDSALGGEAGRGIWGGGVYGTTAECGDIAITYTTSLNEESILMSRV